MKSILLGLSMTLACTATSALAETMLGASESAPATAAAVPPASKRLNSACTSDSSSRIKRASSADGHCDRSAFAGRSYNSEDLKSTGETDLGSALEKLDPGFRR